jgi:type II secretory pathway component PulK
VKSPKPPKPVAAAAVTNANSSDVAQDAATARKKNSSRYDFSKTLLRGTSPMMEGMKNTLG